MDKMFVKCELCDNPAKDSDGIPIQVGNKKFCSLEHMRDYLVESLERFDKKGWM